MDGGLQISRIGGDAATINYRIGVYKRFLLHSTISLVKSILNGKYNASMESIKIQCIDDLIEKRKELRNGWPYNLVIHSVLNTIELYELIEYYIISHSESEIRKLIESNIYKRVVYEYQHEELFDKLLQRLEYADYFQRQRIRKIILLILPFLNISYKYLFFNIFYKSKYIYDVISALSICSELWKDSFNDMILGDYLNKKNEVYLKTFLLYGDIIYTLPYLQNIWNFNPSNYLKIILIKALSKEHIEVFEFLRIIEPDKYLLAISYSNKCFDDDFILNCYNEIDKDLKPYGLMSLGRLKKWNLLENEIKKFVR